MGAAGALGLVAAGALASADTMGLDDAARVAQGGVVIGSASSYRVRAA